jgi:DNA-binding MarR family transcriptional regulator
VTYPGFTLRTRELETWLAYLGATKLLFDELDRRLRDESDLSLADYALLARLGDADEWGMRMTDLADSTVFSRSRTTHAVDRLVKLGSVERRACPTDRRGSYAALTDEGRRKLETARLTHDEVIAQHLLGSMNADDMDVLRHQMEAVRASLEGGRSD